MFDHFAGVVSEQVARAPFFAACVLLVVIWLPSFFFIGNVDTWQLIINTITTIVTFLLVALLQNTQERFEVTVLERLDRIEGLVRDGRR
jgi:low affinity Fe/Cu permease